MVYWGRKQRRTVIWGRVRRRDWELLSPAAREAAQGEYSGSLQRISESDQEKSRYNVREYASLWLGKYVSSI